MNTGQERNKKEMKEGFREWKGGELHKKAINNKVPPTLLLTTNVCLQLTSVQMKAGHPKSHLHHSCGSADASARPSLNTLEAETDPSFLSSCSFFDCVRDELCG